MAVARPEDKGNGNRPGGRLFWPLIVFAVALLVAAPLFGGGIVDYAAAILGYWAGVIVCLATREGGGE